MAAMDQAAALAAFDEQLRRDAQPEGPGAWIERDARVVRHLAGDAGGWSAVLWCDLDEASVDAVIEAQIQRFSALGRSFEWKHYGHDRPADLPRRLHAHGLAAGAEEALMLAAIADLDPDLDAPPPPDVRLVPVTGAAGVADLVRVHEQVFGVQRTALGRDLAAALAQTPDEVAAVVATVDDVPVSAARAVFHRGTQFASLWGGGTLPGYRGRGVYRALVAHRARLARARGFRYLQVDASPESRPILERLGFVKVSTTTPYSML